MFSISEVRKSSMDIIHFCIKLLNHHFHLLNMHDPEKEAVHRNLNEKKSKDIMFKLYSKNAHIDHDEESPFTTQEQKIHLFLFFRFFSIQVKRIM